MSSDTELNGNARVSDAEPPSPHPAEPVQQGPAEPVQQGPSGGDRYRQTKGRGTKRALPQELQEDATTVKRKSMKRTFEV